MRFPLRSQECSNGFQPHHITTLFNGFQFPRALRIKPKFLSIAFPGLACGVPLMRTLSQGSCLTQQIASARSAGQWARLSFQKPRLRHIYPVFWIRAHSCFPTQPSPGLANKCLSPSHLPELPSQHPPGEGCLARLPSLLTLLGRAMLLRISHGADHMLYSHICLCG